MKVPASSISSPIMGAKPRPLVVLAFKPSAVGGTR